MYSLNSNSRRITSYVKEEAYKWLFNKIHKNEYDVGSNRNNQKLMIDIRKEGRITKDSYDKFTKAVLYNPFDSIIQGNKARNKKYISSKKIENFFVKFNGVILPIGFIKDFFEDDYETQAEINKYIESVVKGQEDIFAINCQEQLLEKSNQIADMKLHKPYVFDTKFSFHLCNVIKAILTVLTIIVCLTYIVNENVFQLLITRITSTDRSTLRECDAFLSKYWPHVVLNITVLIFLIPRTIKLVKTVIYYIRLLIIRIHVVIVTRSINQFETTKLESIREYFKSIVPTIARQHEIDDEMSDNAPPAKKQYLAIMRFNASQIEQKIKNLFGSKHFLFLEAYYQTGEKEEIAKKRKIWRKGIIPSILLIIVLGCMNIPEYRELSLDLFEQIKGYLGL